MEPDCREQIMSEDYADILTDFGSMGNIININNTDFCYSTIENSFVVLHIPLEDLPDNYTQIYSYSVNPSCYGLMDIPSAEASGVYTIRTLPATNLRGQSVLIGIIDTGIDYTHKAFLHADGTSRIFSIWDQVVQEGNPPEGFKYGTEYTQEEINNALQTNNPFAYVPTLMKLVTVPSWQVLPLAIL